MKLTYWLAINYDEPTCYALIGRTKESVEEQLNQHPDRLKFEPIQQREIEYEDAFDLFDQVTGEAGGRDY